MYSESIEYYTLLNTSFNSFCHWIILSWPKVCVASLRIAEVRVLMRCSVTVIGCRIIWQGQASIFLAAQKSVVSSTSTALRPWLQGIVGVQFFLSSDRSTYNFMRNSDNCTEGLGINNRLYPGVFSEHRRCLFSILPAKHASLTLLCRYRYRCHCHNGGTFRYYWGEEGFWLCSCTSHPSLEDLNWQIHVDSTRPPHAFHPKTLLGMTFPQAGSIRSWWEEAGMALSANGIWPARHLDKFTLTMHIATSLLPTYNVSPANIGHGPFVLALIDPD